jgi:hypothetical protein
MDAGMDDVVAMLPLADDVAGALVDRAGALGEVLGWAIAFERGDFAALPAAHEDAIAAALRDAIAWADQTAPPLR